MPIKEGWTVPEAGAEAVNSLKPSVKEDLKISPGEGCNKCGWKSRVWGWVGRFTQVIVPI